ncbi:MAG: alpha/beta hydrolase [Pseudomonadota bacterium]
MEERIVQLNGHETRVYASGESGPACLFLHGFPEHGGAWTGLMERMDSFRCFAPDQRGYGISYKPPDVKEYAAGKIARDALALIELLGLERVHVIGHDWGASVAYATVFSRDPRIASLSIANGVHPVPFQRAIATGGAQCAASQYMNWLRSPGSEDVLAANDFEKLASFFAEGMDMSWMTPDVLKIYQAAWKDVDTLRCMINWYRATPLVVGEPGAQLPAEQVPEIPKDVVTVGVPHQLIWGNRDNALLPESTEGLELFCTSGLTRHVFEDADHWICHQKPDEVAALIRDFVALHD